MSFARLSTAFSELLFLNKKSLSKEWTRARLKGPKIFASDRKLS